MKTKLTLLTLLLTIGFAVQAQDREEIDEQKGFKKENLFTGGSATLSFGNRQSLYGVNPMFGYALADWADAGLVFNFSRNTIRDYYANGDKLSNTTLGPGVFTRIYPLKFLFVQGQFERNMSTVKYSSPLNSQDIKERVGSNSLLVGAGYASGRQPRNSTFFYISVLFDVLKDENSPYVGVSYNQYNQPRTTIIPIIRAGVNVALFQGSYGRY